MQHIRGPALGERGIAAGRGRLTIYASARFWVFLGSFADGTGAQLDNCCVDADRCG